MDALFARSPNGALVTQDPAVSQWVLGVTVVSKHTRLTVSQWFLSSRRHLDVKIVPLVQQVLNNGLM